MEAIEYMLDGIDYALDELNLMLKRGDSRDDLSDKIFEIRTMVR